MKDTKEHTEVMKKALTSDALPRVICKFEKK